MKTKHVVTTVIVIAVLAIAYGVYAMRTVQAPEPSPTPMPSAKINIDEVCQGALAYTTFTDGAAAEAFVEDCKAGKHPEVIEQYITNLGIDGAQI